MTDSFSFKLLFFEDIFLDKNYYSEKYNNSNNTCSLILNENYFFNKSSDFDNSELDIEKNIENNLLCYEPLKDIDIKNIEFVNKKNPLCDEKLEVSDIENIDPSSKNNLLCDEVLEYIEEENLSLGVTR